MNSNLKIIPLGGLDQIGMNITVFEYDDSIIVVDCGLSFPEDDMLGIDLVIPDITYLLDNADKVKGLVITHGHEDHIGAVPYFLKQLNIPVYGTKLTVALIEGKLKEHEILDISECNIVNYGDVIKLGDFDVEFIRTNHSITDAAALAIKSPAGTVVHTGDFKVDYTPVFGEAIDLNRFAQLGDEGVLAMMCDSTNAERSGFTNSEKTVGKAFDTIFSEHTHSRILVATFASNVDRVQQIISCAYKYGRKVVVEGRSMINIIEKASEIGYINIPEGTLIDISEVANYPDDKIVIITTGSQGESMAALSRIATNIHKKLSIKAGDTVIFSSNPIPGNEKAVSNIINELSLKGAEVIYQDAHVSGHACREEIKLLYTLVKPQYAIPVHGEHKHLRAQKAILEELGFSKDNIFILANGQVLEFSQAEADRKAADRVKVTDTVPTGAVFVDGLGVGDVGNQVLRDRQKLANSGILIVTMALETGTNIVASGPTIISKGFVYTKEAEELMVEAEEIVIEAMHKIQERDITSRNRIRELIRDALSGFIWTRLRRNPVILSILMDVD